jgi:DNA-binding response OmpR family regulator
MSGYPGGTAARDGALEPGAQYVDKPFTPTALLEKVEAILRRTARAPS